MVEVFFECPSYAESIGIMEEWVYNEIYPKLEEVAVKNGFEIVTETYLQNYKEYHMLVTLTETEKHTLIQGLNMAIGDCRQHIRNINRDPYLTDEHKSGYTDVTRSEILQYSELIAKIKNTLTDEV